MKLPEPPILVITDRRQCADGLETRAEALFQGGCRWLSLREKDLPSAERLALLQRLITVGRVYGALVGVHGDIAAASACCAPLHLAADSDPVAGRAATYGLLLGISCHDREELSVAAAAGADYATLSPIFGSLSKPLYRPKFRPADLATITARSALPVLALGGVTAATLPELTGSGIAGIAVMGEAMRTADATTWFAALTRGWQSHARVA